MKKIKNAATTQQPHSDTTHQKKTKKSESYSFEDSVVACCFDVLTSPGMLETWVKVDKAYVNEQLDTLIQIKSPWRVLPEAPDSEAQGFFFVVFFF